MRNNVVIFVNGRLLHVAPDALFMMLADFLREKLTLFGTKIVCAEGDCGACTVLCYRPKPDGNGSFEPINSCITLVAQLDGCHVLTVESLKEQNQLSAVQEAIVKHHGSQCGFCTPGFAMAMTAMIEKSACISEQKVKNCLTGNLCRCTGYQPLIQAALSLEGTKETSLVSRYITRAAIDELREATQEVLHVIDDDKEFFAPKTIDDACAWRSKYQDGTLMLGATDLGVMVNKGKITLRRIMSFQSIDDLWSIKTAYDRIHVGARVSLSEVRSYVKQSVPEFARFLNIFASWQIKNMGTLVGNVMNGSPIGDTLPFLMVADGRVHVEKTGASRTISLPELFLDYKKLSLLPDEIVTHISFAIPKKSHILKLEKVSQRRDLDISTVNGAFLFDVDEQAHVIRQARIALGGVFKTVLRMKRAEDYLAGKVLSEKLVHDALAMLLEDITPLSDVRGSMDYRRAVVDGLFRRSFAKVLGARHE